MVIDSQAYIFTLQLLGVQVREILNKTLSIKSISKKRNQ